MKNLLNRMMEIERFSFRSSSNIIRSLLLQINRSIFRGTVFESFFLSEIFAWLFIWLFRSSTKV